ncbi:glutamine--fructose-6-phosphate transaminase (isomerizing) [Candidatus Daviesbacteria bacterium]|nr:glutamine--fructose-6-phosphate transaminase (isomerizing) [Candidatus Daviesbacteria bacterium]
MCGIVGSVERGGHSTEIVMNGLREIEYRGYDSWGVALATPDGLIVEKQIGKLPTSWKLGASNVAIGHTRWATHGGVTEANAHPHTDCSNRLALVHNGIIENHDLLRSGLTNHNFRSQTDTEVVAHLIEQIRAESGTDLLHATASGVRRLEGLNAMVVTDGSEVVAFRNGSPLVLGQLERGFAVASDVYALAEYTNRFCFLDNGDLVYLNGSAVLYDSGSMTPKNPEFVERSFPRRKAIKGDFPTFMLKEIYEQPEVLEDTRSRMFDLDKIAKVLNQKDRLFLAGCGSAAYACLAGFYLISEQTNRLVHCSVGSEYQPVLRTIGPNDGLLAISQSGETIDLIDQVVAAQQRGVEVLGMVNVYGSTLHRMVDRAVLLDCGQEKAVVATKSMTAMLAQLILLSHAMGGGLDGLLRGAETLRETSKASKKVLDQLPRISKLAAKLADKSDIFVLGRGLSYPIALETALKIKETSYIHAEGFAGGELKHGVMALIEEDTPVIVFAPEDDQQRFIISNAEEVKARGAYVIGVSPKRHPVFDIHFPVGNLGNGSAILNIIFGQLLGHELAVQKRLDPDKPRNLAKSVVVR